MIDRAPVARSGALRTLPAAAVHAAPSAPFQALACALTCLYLYLIYSRVMEFMTAPKLVFVVTLAALLAIIAGGGIRIPLRNPAVLLLCGFTVWMIIGFPFSYWKGGTFEVLKEQWVRVLLALIIIPGGVQTLRQARAISLTVAMGACTVGLISLQAAGGDERLTAEVGTFSNPNTVAEHILLGLPFCWYFLARRPGSWFIRLLGMALIPVMIALQLRTGSRAGLLTVVILCGYVFFRVSVLQKAFILVAAVTIVIAAFTVLPASVADRYKTLLSGDEEAGQSIAAESADESAKSRKKVLFDSIRMTFQYPIFGVGPGNFAPVAAEDSKEAGLRPVWLVTHNTYTQISSETGFPGLFFFMGCVIVCFRSTFRVHKRVSAIPELATLTSMASALRLSWIAFFVLGFFDHFGYSLYVPLLAGLTTILVEVSNKELAMRPGLADTRAG